MAESNTINLIEVLSDAEVAAIEAEATHLPNRESAAIEALQIVQAHRGWVSDASLNAIAAQLGMSPAQLDSIATFYNLIFRQPVGRHVIMACDSVSCFVMGSDGVRDALVERLGIQPGQTTGDDRFTLLPIVCLGACDHAPTIMIDDELIGDVQPDGLDAILERFE